MRLRPWFPALPALLLGLAPLPASATLGVFEHGNGLQSMAMGGVGYSVGFETTALGANPAHALDLGNRFDVGVDMFWAEATARYRGNQAGPDAVFESDGKSYYAIPQGGYSRRLSENLGFGLTMLSAGLGPSYDGSPYERFGSNRRVSLNLASTSLVSALAWRVHADHTLGLSLNLGYQQLDAKGLEFLANPQSSVAPDHVTNQGKDGALTAGFSLGWLAQLRPDLRFGVAYRSRNWTQKHKEYRGLLPEGGRLELPPIYGAGVSWEVAPRWTVALDYQRYDYTRQRAFRNGLSRFTSGNLLGTAKGPGFGFGDQEAVKLGVSWKATPQLALRAGYVWATQPVQERETLFGALGCLTGTNQYAAGATWTLREWEFTGMAAHLPKRTVRGEGSIPEAFGGGEIDVSDTVINLGFSVGRRF